MDPGPTLLSGGSGLIGGRLLAALSDRGLEVRALTRDPARVRPLPAVHAVRWNGMDVPAETLRDASAVVHLSGAPIFGPPTRAHRRRVRESRVESTRRLVARIAELPGDARPEVLVCASAVGFYGDRGDRELREDERHGWGFVADLCSDWEREAERVEALGVRRVSLRFGVVLSREGGALALLRILFSLGLGGRVGSGRQWFPWIHIGDATALVLAALEMPELSGPVNTVAPEPVRNAELARTLGRILGRPAILPLPAFAVRAALGPIAGELLGSRRVVPARARAAGLSFAYPDLETALRAELTAG